MIFRLLFLVSFLQFFASAFLGPKTCNNQFALGARFDDKLGRGESTSSELAPSKLSLFGPGLLDFFDWPSSRQLANLSPTRSSFTMPVDIREATIKLYVSTYYKVKTSNIYRKRRNIQLSWICLESQNRTLILMLITQKES